MGNVIDIEYHPRYFSARGKSWRTEMPPNVEVLAGSRFGHWTLVSLSKVKKDRKATWRCLCDCGNERDVIERTLVNGTSTNCGCMKAKATGDRLRVDLTGKKFGGWLVVRYEGLNQLQQPTWFCRCQCGSERVVVGQSLRVGASRSCGCSKGPAIARARTKHGHTRLVDGGKSRTYRIWEAMHGRCKGNNESGRKYYVHYGIKVCARWADFRNFLADMGEAPPDRSLDRYPNSRGDYEPGNCRWATSQQQTDNRTTSGHVVRLAPDLELIEELERRGYDMSAIVIQNREQAA